jgi:hypothetical protein
VKAWWLMVMVGCGGAPDARPSEALQPVVATTGAAAEPAASTATSAGIEPASAPIEPVPEPKELVLDLTGEQIKPVVRASYDRMGACYKQGLDRDPKLAGTIDVHLAIGEDGAVLGADAPKKKSAKPGRKRADKLMDPEVVECVEKVFMTLRFPPSRRGMVQLVYPVVFAVE